MRILLYASLALTALLETREPANAQICNVMGRYVMDKSSSSEWVLKLDNFEAGRITNVYGGLYGGHPNGNATLCDFIISSIDSFVNKSGRDHDLLLGFGVGDNPLKAVQLTFFPHESMTVSTGGPDQYIVRLRGHIIRVCWLKKENTWAHNSDPNKDGPCIVKSNDIPSSW